MSEICPIVMPKWGLSMEEGTIVEWYVEEGEPIAVGQDLVDIETPKINNVLEAVDAGILRRITIEPGQTVDCGVLIGVVADASTDEVLIEKFVAEYENGTDNGSRNEEGEAISAPRSVDAQGFAIQYSEQGADQTPVLFIHGFGGDKDNWLFLQSEIAKSRRTIALDLPGHGESTKDLRDLEGVGGFASVCADFLSAIDATPAHLVAHSFGGAIALALAQTYPQHVRSLSLIAPAGLGTDINMDYINGFVDASRARELKEVLSLLFADSKLVSREMVDNIVKYKRLDGAIDALRNIAAATFPDGRQVSTFGKEIGDLQQPALVVWGQQDAIIPCRHADDLPEWVKVAKLPDVGHMPHIESSGTVGELISAHIDATEI